MDIQEETKGSLVVVAPNGRVDGFTSPELEKRISEIIERGDHRVLLDCENMEYISSAGLRVVSSARRSARTKAASWPCARSSPRANR